MEDQTTDPQGPPATPSDPQAPEAEGEEGGAPLAPEPHPEAAEKPERDDALADGGVEVIAVVGFATLDAYWRQMGIEPKHHHDSDNVLRDCEAAAEAIVADPDGIDAGKVYHLLTGRGAKVPGADITEGRLFLGVGRAILRKS